MTQVHTTNPIKNNLAALAVGFIFALGIGVAGMARPEKVIGFLDLFGNWDPSLIFVMAGSILVHSITYRLIRKRSSPLFSPQWHVPTKRAITPALVIGSFLFGVGWGIAGYCPGPALTSLASLSPAPLVFVVMMLAGMGLFRQLDKRLNLAK